MKPSRYNFFYDYEPEPNKMIAYNAMTNSLALIERENYKKFEDFVNDGKEIDDEELVEKLRTTGFLIDEGIDELKQLRYQLFRDRFSRQSLSLTIAPTSDCNFRCVYCYEKDVIKNAYMNEEVELSIINFVKNYIALYKIHHLIVTWYGGEPLLAPSTIKRLSASFKGICEENRIEYISSIITNGYLINEDTIQMFIDCGIKNVQITLDGNEQTHNHSRPLVGNKPTFSRIMDNLKHFYNKDINVSIRINVDKNNIDEYKEILAIFKDNKVNYENITPYIGWIEKINNEAYDGDNCLELDSFSEENFAFEKHKNINANANKYGVFTKRKTAFCGADSIDNLLINSDGAIYNCWTDLGNIEFSRGNIVEFRDIQVEKSKTFLSYIMYDPTEDPECKICTFVPICMGGCPKRRINGHAERCTEEKYVLEKKLKETVYRIKQCAEITQ